MGITDFIKDNLLEKQDEQADSKTIRITCQGATTVDIDQLNDLQPENFKTSSTTDYKKLRQSILENGFSFAVDMWIDHTGKKWVIDSHRRKKTLLKMRDEEGFIIPPLPADIIHAKNKTEAKKKLLAAASSYGEVNEVGLTDFLNEEGFEIQTEEVADFVSFPEIDYFSSQPEEEPKDPPAAKESTEYVCPECHHTGDKDEFIPK